MKLSKSAVNSFLKCRREFKYQCIDKIQSKSNEYMRFGSLIHNTAEKIAKDLKELEEINESIIHAIFLRHYPHTNEFNNDQIALHLENLYKFFIQTFVNDQYKIFSIEEYIHDKDYNLSGLADLVLENDYGDLIVIDYKTSKSKSIKEYRIELCYYKKLIEYVHSDKKVVTAGIYFTKDAKYRFANFVETQSKGSYITQNDYLSALDLLDFIRQEVNLGNLYPHRQFLCQYCAYSSKCEQDGGY